MTALVYFLVDANGQESEPRVRVVEESRGGAHWFADMASSRSIMPLDRSGFRELYRFARSGDTLIVSSLDCLGANQKEVMTVLRRLNQKGVMVTCV